MIRATLQTLYILSVIGIIALGAAPAALAQPAPPAGIVVSDAAWDDGTKLEVQFQLSTSEPEKLSSATDPAKITYIVLRSEEQNGIYEEVAQRVASPQERALAKSSPGTEAIRVTIEKCHRGEPYFFRVYATQNGTKSTPITSSSPVAASRQMFDIKRLPLFLTVLFICGAVITFILLARSGRPMKVRKIAGLNAIDEAVGRATEMGRSCLFVPGILDINDVQTIAGMNILARVTKTAAEFNAKIDVPTSKSLVMTAARETLHGAFLSAGRPDAYNEDMAYYVTDEQFGYVAFITGKMVREKPAACFYFGAFYAESLILAETGNNIGAIQVAGTAMPSQLPFFVAACDYTLIGEELFAASAYLSGSPEELGALKGQDFGKLVGAIIITVGCAGATVASATGLSESFNAFINGLFGG